LSLLHLETLVNSGQLQQMFAPGSLGTGNRHGQRWDLDYVRARGDQLMVGAHVDVNDGGPLRRAAGCLIPDVRRRLDGYINVHLREPSHQTQAKGHLVVLFAFGYWELEGYEGSHLCHNGAEGCCNIDHLIIEPHDVHQQRTQRNCWCNVECPYCRRDILGNPCLGHWGNIGAQRVQFPYCIRPNLTNPCVCM